MKTLQDKLRNLTVEQCLKIAEMAYPDINWIFYSSRKHPWDGHDLIDKNSQESDWIEYIFQIDYRDEKELNGKSRFRFYKDTFEYTVFEEKVQQIINYIS